LPSSIATADRRITGGGSAAAWGTRRGGSATATAAGGAEGQSERERLEMEVGTAGLGFSPDGSTL
jgi:hypothetical protein